MEQPAFRHVTAAVLGSLPSCCLRHQRAPLPQCHWVIPLKENKGSHSGRPRQGGGCDPPVPGFPVGHVPVGDMRPVALRGSALNKVPEVVSFPLAQPRVRKSLLLREGWAQCRRAWSEEAAQPQGPEPSVLPPRALLRAPGGPVSVTVTVTLPPPPLRDRLPTPQITSPLLNDSAHAAASRLVSGNSDLSFTEALN